MESVTRFWFRPAAGAPGLALFLFAAVALNAQQPDPSVRAVRLSDAEGQVQLSQGGQIQADHALVNTPLFEGNQLTTREDGRAEIQFDDGSVVRLSPNSTLLIGTLRQQSGVLDAELVLQSGLAYFELQGDTAASRISARFGDTVVTASGFTVLRINLDNPPGDLAVFSGNAHLDRANALSVDMHGGESITLDAANPGRYNLAETIEPDSWDAWNSDRDQDLGSQEAARTAATTNVENPNNPAWSDLDANGNWYNVPGQGNIWSPYEAANPGFDPYGCGSWVFTPRFGYVWVSCYSWGYMPYGFGSWNYYDGFGWGWMAGGDPWWWGGGWAPNVGNGPFRYQPPHRPRGGPVRPIGGGIGHEPYPVVSVNRTPDRPVTGPVRVGNGPVLIGGVPAQPLRPISPRPVYGSLNGRPVNGFGGNVRPGYTVWPNNGGEVHTGPGVWPSNGYNYHPPAPGRPSAPSGGGSRTYGGGSSPRPSGGGSSHGSSGGGGGGSHVSSGGGGGGSHASSSGGGHH